MNARQMKKRLKKQIKHLEYDNDLMRHIIDNNEDMKALYLEATKPVIGEVLQYPTQIYHVKIPIYLYQQQGATAFQNRILLNYAKNEAERKLFEAIKPSIDIKIFESTLDEPACVCASIIAGMPKAESEEMDDHNKL